MLLEIVNSIVQKLGNTYTVINAYDNTEELDPSGAISVTIGEVENLHHGNSKDCKLTVNINGYILTVQDTNQQKINAMFEYVYYTITESWLKTHIENCAGALINTGTINSDGESNNFSITEQLYLSIDEDVIVTVETELFNLT